MYGMCVAGVPTRFGSHVRVGSVADLDYLIKERELLLGEQGRKFVARADDGDIEFDVSTIGCGFEVKESKSAAGAKQYFVAASELHQSMLGQCIAYGRLFTEAI